MHISHTEGKTILSYCICSLSWFNWCRYGFRFANKLLQVQPLYTASHTLYSLGEHSYGCTPGALHGQPCNQLSMLKNNTATMPKGIRKCIVNKFKIGVCKQTENGHVTKQISAYVHPPIYQNVVLWFQKQLLPQH